VLAPLAIVPLDEAVWGAAAAVGSSLLRSLDAIHLASALSLGDDLGGFCCYDLRLRADAKDAGLNVLSPGLD
jgi:predicted nucleic acid-binding protein